MHNENINTKRFYINVKFEKYGTYTIEARSKEHAIEIYKDGDYGWSDYTEDFGEFNEQIEDVEEELFADTQLSLGVLAQWHYVTFVATLMMEIY